MKRSRILAVAAVFLWALVVMPSSAGAQTQSVADLQAQIQALLAQIQSLQAAVGVLSGNQVSTKPVGSGSFVDLVTTAQYSNGNQSAFITATIKGSALNRNVSYWTLDISCTKGIVIPAKGGSLDMCGAPATVYRSNLVDPTQDYLVLTVSAENRGIASNPNVVLALVAHAADGSHLGGDKEGIPLGFSNVRPAASLRVVSPNGGERWMLNSGNTVIEWNPDPHSTAMDAYLEKKRGNTFVTVGKVVEAAKGSIQWLGEIDRAGNYAQPGDGYYIRLVNRVTGETDRSDRPFTILPIDHMKVDLKINGSDQPITLPKNGGTVTLSWTSRNATSCTFSPGELGLALYGLPSSGQSTVFLRGNTAGFNYAVHMICYGEAGSRSDYVEVLFSSVSKPVPAITSFTATSPSRTTGAVTLSWRTLAAAEAMIGMACPESGITSLSLYIPEDNRSVNCDDRRGLVTYHGQAGNAITIQPKGNAQPVIMGFALYILNSDGSLSGESRKLTVTFPSALGVSPTPVGVRGAVSGVDTDDQTLRGWVVDPSATGNTVLVSVYVDGTNFSGRLLGEIAAGNIWPNGGYVGNHGFGLVIPSWLRDGRTHTLNVYAVQSGRTRLSSPVLLPGSPASFTIANTVSAAGN